MVNTLVESAKLLTDEALAAVLLSLRRFRIAPWSELLHPILNESIYRLNSFELVPLSKWCVSVKSFNETGRLILPAALPALEKFISQCRTLQESRVITTCFITIAHLLNKNGETATKYACHLSHLLDNGTINRNTPLRDLVKFLRALYFLVNLSYLITKKFKPQYNYFAISLRPRTMRTHSQLPYVSSDF